MWEGCEECDSYGNCEELIQYSDNEKTLQAIYEFTYDDNC